MNLRTRPPTYPARLDPEPGPAPQTPRSGRMCAYEGLIVRGFGNRRHARKVTERPLAFRASFPPTAASVRAARSFVGSVVNGPEEVRDRALLLTSELATNVVRHAATDFEVILRPLSDTTARVWVKDHSTNAPVICERPVDGEDGRGMTLVAALASAWGVDRRPDGKAVWFDLPISLRSGSDPRAR